MLHREVSEEELRRYLAERLPSYMVPARIATLIINQVRNISMRRWTMMYWG
ncbi:amino acid adenylation domain-containing protein [Paenibacillus sp. SYP-B3998]|uniref:Amino acid adenylation domain-containing protein n=1 Tax=Paenibacillus sp. SYP-B3998 TaxID=2678564 RepID=A0A6G3ZYS9_9BACL|nr:amino acid adenylation domain-containing protein [Paenibacillus sp. SYP-B3998]